eukprot:COSAG02_NODE_12592_length_1521_cov_2.133615_1_plen_302_part_00
MEPEPESELANRTENSTRLAPIYRELRDRMPDVERALVVENVSPGGVSAEQLIEALGLTDTEHDWETRLCRAEDIQHVPAALSPVECAALRAAVDAAALSGKAVVGHGDAAASYVDSEDTWQTEDSEGKRQDFMQLALTRETLTCIVGKDAVARLWELAATRSHRTAAEFTAPPEPHNIFARRYTPLDGVPWCPFHHDVSRCTVNVALSDDSAHGDGRLLVVFDGKVQRVVRSKFTCLNVTCFNIQRFRQVEIHVPCMAGTGRRLCYGTPIVAAACGLADDARGEVFAHHLLGSGLSSLGP